MRLYPQSLRQKIFLGYVLGLILVLLFVALTWSNLNILQQMVTSGQVVTDLFDSTLEIRRFEKNYFLYRTGEDYQELLGYVDRAQELTDREELMLFTDVATLDALREDLDFYRDLLREDAAGSEFAHDPQLEQSIRDNGKKIVDAAAAISGARDTIKADALMSAKRNFLIGIAVLLSSGLAGAYFFYRKALQPLSVLEKHMRRIADGGFSLINYQFKDSELISLKTAFNKMLVELEERQEHLVQSEKLASMGTLVFGVAHELNNPISNISSSCQILREEIDDGDVEYQKELVQQIYAETERARDVVTSILEFSRAHEKEAFGLRKAIEETIRFVRVEVPSTIGIETTIPRGLEVFGDRQKIQQLVLNLVMNAVDAMPGEGEIKIHASAPGEPGGMAELVVRDNGTGMDPETMEQIFTPFFSSKKKEGGYGLGLFIVHNIVEEHRGSIYVDSYPDKGTVFTITLPTKEISDDE